MAISLIEHVFMHFLGCLATVGLLAPRNLRVSDEWYTRFRVAWDPVPAPILGYKLVYSPEGELTFILEFFIYE